MLWHQHYSTSEVRHLVAPDYPPELKFGEPWILLGLTRLSGHRDFGIWYKLFSSTSNVSLPFVVGLIGFSEEEKAQANEFFPKSISNNFTYFDSTWRDLFESTNGNGCVTCLIFGNLIPLVLFGGPTEEAWDTLVQEYQTISDQSK